MRRLINFEQSVNMSDNNSNWNPFVDIDSIPHNDRRRLFYNACGLMQPFMDQVMSTWQRTIDEISGIPVDRLIDGKFLTEQEAKDKLMFMLPWVMETIPIIKQQMSNLSGVTVTKMTAFEMEYNTPSNSPMPRHYKSALCRIGLRFQEALEMQLRWLLFVQANVEYYQTQEVSKMVVGRDSVRDYLRFELVEAGKEWKNDWLQETKRFIEYWSAADEEAKEE